MLWLISNKSFSSPSAGSMWGYFFNVHCENLGILIEVKLTKALGLLTTVLCSLKKKSLRLIHNEPSAIHIISIPMSALLPIDACTHGFLLQQVLVL
jgi:hypothetical protein